MIFAEGMDQGSWENKRFSYFQNTACEYFPCHQTDTPHDFNCLFCFCPLYSRKDCGGCFTYTQDGVKDCSACLLPHKHANYSAILKRLREASLKKET
jgi:Zn-finger protein